MSWIRKALGLCQHKWAIVRRYYIGEREPYQGELLLLQCEHCGDLKKNRIQ